MLRRIAWLVVAVLAAASLGGGSAWAAGEMFVIAVPPGVGTPITSLPYTIKHPGFYYFKKNLIHTGNGSAITIETSEVTLDLMGFSLSPASYRDNDGIYIKGDLKNVEVRNGQIKNFWFGVSNDLDSNCANFRFANLKLSDCHFGMMLYRTVYGLIMTGCQATGNDDGFNLSTTLGAVIDQNIATHNSGAGFDFTGAVADSNGLVVTNNVATNNGTGFGLPPSPGVLLDRNVSQNNTHNSMIGYNDCTKGLNAFHELP